MTTSPDQVLLHPVRLRIVLVVAGRQMTAQEMQGELTDIPHATLYRHINRLHEAGVLAVVAERTVRGGVERTFALAESAASFTANDLATKTEEELLGYFTRFAASLIGDFARYLASGSADLERDGVGFRQVPVWLDDVEFADLAAQMTRILRAAHSNGPGEGRRRRIISTIVMPGEQIAIPDAEVAKT